MSVGQGTLPVAPLPICMIWKASLSILGEGSVMELGVVNSHTQVPMTQERFPRLTEKQYEEMLGKKTCYIKKSNVNSYETCIL